MGILDKATLTLGDNRKVDFSRTVIFMTSNLGAAEMSKIIQPKLGFSMSDENERANAGTVDAGMRGKISRSGIEAARRRFTPEFMNRLDEIVTFQPLGAEQLRKILDIELNLVQQRIFNAAPNAAFVFTLTDKAKEFLIEQGTDLKYGARHLKRTIERLLVQAMSNLISTGQVRGGDWILADVDQKDRSLSFVRQAEGLPVQDMARLVDSLITILPVVVTEDTIPAGRRLKK